ncbi:MAG: phosphonopyruvate decarboxylase [Candidatus Electrothrix scaldis]|nr:MAG: phosphonopyruvate decarboxylase [Candidatus Electrothrix sp. GW3-3]
MLTGEELCTIFQRYDLTYFCGVPDSTLKHWLHFLDQHRSQGLTNRIVSIERDAVGWAAGYHAATEKIGTVYLQNSGLGNIVNPVTSLLDPAVYNIPVLLLIGWRGRPGEPDEPQHSRMGAMTEGLLDLMGICYSLLPDTVQAAEQVVAEAKRFMTAENAPYALIVPRKTFAPSVGGQEEAASRQYELGREEALGILLKTLHKNNVIVATTGKLSRELFEYREAFGSGHAQDFLMVGSMGLASSFAAEIALQRPEQRVYILDGDGALLMNAGVLSTIGYYAPKNLVHLVFDNHAYDSTGGQPSTSSATDFARTALANSYREAATVSSAEELRDALTRLPGGDGPTMLVIKVRKGARPDLGRPTTSPVENKLAFMNQWGAYFPDEIRNRAEA